MGDEPSSERRLPATGIRASIEAEIATLQSREEPSPAGARKRRARIPTVLLILGLSFLLISVQFFIYLNSSSFLVTPSTRQTPTVGPTLTPTAGPAGSPSITVTTPAISGESITVSGQNFPAGSIVEVDYGLGPGADACSNAAATATVGQDGSFSLSFKAPSVSQNTAIAIVAIEPQGSCERPAIRVAKNSSIQVKGAPLAAPTLIYYPVGILLLLLLLLLLFLLFRTRRRQSTSLPTNAAPNVSLTQHIQQLEQIRSLFEAHPELVPVVDTIISNRVKASERRQRWQAVLGLVVGWLLSLVGTPATILAFIHWLFP